MHQLENGYTRIANTILEGMARKKMPGTCFRIMLWVFRNSYGYSQKWTKSKSGRQIAKEICMSSASTLLAIQVLLDSGLLIRNENGEYSLNKKGLSVQDIGQVRVSKELDKSVQDLGQSVQDIGQSECNYNKETLKEKKDIAFGLFWKAYPKRMGKKTALKAWKKENPPLDKCLKTLEWQVASDQWKKDGGQFIPLPATWINQGRWEDVRPGYIMVTCSVCGEEGSLPQGYKGVATCAKCSQGAFKAQIGAMGGDHVL